MLPRRKRSGGPQTDAGKQASSRNALKTGAYSTLIVLPGESEEDFKNLEEQFQHDFSPRDIVEAAMVRSLAVIIWKKLRVEKLEHAGLIRKLSESFELLEYSKIRYDFEGHSQEKVLGLARVTEEGHVADWRVGFELLHQFSKQGATAKELDQLQNNAPLVYEFLLIAARDLGIEGRGHLAWSKLQVKNRLDESYDFITNFSKKFISRYKEQEWVVDHFNDLKAMVLDIQESRLLKFMQFNSAQRVYDDLDRAFYKTLGELRQHQRWRRDMQAIDVTLKGD